MIIKKHKFLFSVVATVFLFLVLNLGYFIATNWRNFLPKKAIPIAPKAEQKVYENQKLGLELKYPPEWIVKENEDSIEINPPTEENQYNRIYFSLTPRREYASLDEVKEKFAGSIDIKPYEFGQIKGFEYLDGGYFDAVWFMHKDTIYVARKYATSTEARKILESISFKE